MPSKARKAFDENAKDIEKLLRLHEQEGGTAKGRRFGLEVLNKSAIVLITSYWEAYCEDIAAEALEHLVKHLKDAANLPVELKKQVAKELKNDPHDLAVWKLSGSGWSKHLKSRLNDLRQERSRRLNTPKYSNIDGLFHSAIGVADISCSWTWARKMTVARARKKLDKYVTLRGEIAHRGKAAKSVKKADAVDYFDFIQKVAGKTGGAVNTHVKRATGKALW